MYFRLTHTGELFYVTPDPSEEEIAYERIAKKCRDAAKLEFGNDVGILDRLEKELEVLKGSSSSVIIEIVDEIVKFSEKMGYPVKFDGESGLLIFYLLGISGIHPSRLNYSTLYTDTFESRSGIPVCMAIAESVASLLEPRLIEKFKGVECDYHNYERLRVYIDKTLDDIGKISVLANISFNEIDLDDPRIKDETASDIAGTELNWDLHAEFGYCIVDPEECLAYESCSTIGAEKTKDLFEKVRKYVFRDEVYDELIKLGIEKDRALKMCRLWSRGEKREAEIDLLKELEAPEQLIIAFQNLFNVWPKDACISRVKIMKMLKYFKLKHHHLYGSIREYDLPE